jgi:hypothetical protein
MPGEARPSREAALTSSDGGGANNGNRGRRDRRRRGNRGDRPDAPPRDESDSTATPAITQSTPHGEAMADATAFAAEAATSIPASPPDERVEAPPAIAREVIEARPSAMEPERVEIATREPAPVVNAAPAERDHDHAPPRRSTVEFVAPPVEVPTVALTLPPDSDLVLVETSHKSDYAPEPETPSGPRRSRRPRAQLVDEPLQIVETRKDQPPAA